MTKGRKLEIFGPVVARLLGCTNWPGIARESAIVGEHSVHGNGGRPVKPGKEREFLQVVGEAVQRYVRNEVSGQRVAVLQVVLASPHLSGVAPGRSWVVPYGIVHPFPDFMRHDGRIQTALAENSGGVEVKYGKGLRRAIGGKKRAVEAAYATFLQVPRRTHRHARAVDHEDGEGAGIHLSLSHQRRQNLAFNQRSKEIDVHGSKNAARAAPNKKPAGKGGAIGGGHVHQNGIQDVQAKGGVKADPVLHRKKVGSLKGINVLRSTYIGVSKDKLRRTEHGRLLDYGIRHAAAQAVSVGHGWIHDRA